MKNSLFHNQDDQILLQNFINKFPPEVLSDNPRFSYSEIELMDHVIKQIKMLEKKLESLESLDDKNFIVEGKYFYKMALFFLSTWFLLGKIVLMDWFSGFVISLFMSLFSIWMLVANDRKVKDYLNDRKSSEKKQVNEDLFFYLSKKGEIEKRHSISELNEDQIRQFLEDFLFWERHENERKILRELQLKAIRSNN